MSYRLQVHSAQRLITPKFRPYLNGFQFDEAILAQATPAFKGWKIRATVLSVGSNTKQRLGRVN